MPFQIKFVILLLVRVRSSTVASPPPSPLALQLAAAVHGLAEPSLRAAKLRELVAEAWSQLDLLPPPPLPAAVLIEASGAATLEMTQRTADRATLETLWSASCAHHLSCGACLATAGCGWCIGERDCVADVPWLCQGEDDHVGTIGTHKVCPVPVFTKASSPPDDQVEREETAAAAAAAAQPPPPERDTEVMRRAALAKSTPEAAEPYGGTHPYEVLDVNDAATNSEIRKAYRALSLLLHPDRFARASDAVQAASHAAFADLVAAYEVLSIPEKRAAFDDFGANPNFNTEWEWAAYGDGQSQDFYRGSPHITHLDERRWERYGASQRSAIWLVEFYAPWCGACQRFSGTFKDLAASLHVEDDVEVGVVNCVSESALCQASFNVRSYPTLRLVNVAQGMMQEFAGASAAEAPVIAAWVRTIAREWRWLWAHSDVRRIASAAEFEATVQNSTKFWCVVFLDGEGCGPCKTAKTNAMRLSASLVSTTAARSAGVATVDCAASPKLREWCTENIGVPAAPHAPQVRGFASGDRGGSDDGGDGGGEVLYSANEVRPHVALRIIERVARLALAKDREEEGEDEGNQEQMRELYWGAPTGRAAMNAAAAADGMRTSASPMISG